MTLLEDARAAVDTGRQILDDVGLREFQVFARLETYSAAIAPGVTLTAADEVEILPRPRVEKMDGEEATWYGAGEMITDAGGKSVVSVYTIEGITPEFSLGGYSLNDLMRKPTSPAQRFVIRLMGPGISDLLRDGGEPFFPIVPKRISTLENGMIVRRIPVVHTKVT